MSIDVATLKAAAVVLLGLGAVVALGRIVFLLVARRPVLAVTLGTSVSEEERLAQRHKYRIQRFGGPLFDEDTPLDTHLLRVKYVVDGREYRQQVRKQIRAGDPADPAPLLWYDPADPSRVTAEGLGMPLLGLVLALGSAAALAGWL